MTSWSHVGGDVAVVDAAGVALGIDENEVLIVLDRVRPSAGAKYIFMPVTI